LPREFPTKRPKPPEHRSAPLGAWRASDNDPALPARQPTGTPPARVTVILSRDAASHTSNALLGGGVTAQSSPTCRPAAAPPGGGMNGELNRPHELPCGRCSLRHSLVTVNSVMSKIPSASALPFPNFGPRIEHSGGPYQGRIPPRLQNRRSGHTLQLHRRHGK